MCFGSFFRTLAVNSVSDFSVKAQLYTTLGWSAWVSRIKDLIRNFFQMPQCSLSYSPAFPVRSASPVCSILCGSRAIPLLTHYLLWINSDAKINVAPFWSAKDPELSKAPSLTPWVNQSIALHSPCAFNCISSLSSSNIKSGCVFGVYRKWLDEFVMLCFTFSALLILLNN